jgi:hypothetical protein
MLRRPAKGKTGLLLERARESLRKAFNRPGLIIDELVAAHY